jgi:hypothetical protein
MDLTAFRQAPMDQSWFLLNQQLVENQRSYRPPVAAWRFYLRLPLAEEYDVMAGSRDATRAYPYGGFSRARLVLFQNLTLKEMVISIIAIKRYELREGKSPSSLAALLPDFLDATPRDFMDGQPLRYRLNSDGSFALYSVGKDGHDDGGDPMPEATTTTSDGDTAPWNGRDWVWPQTVATARPLPKI